MHKKMQVFKNLELDQPLRIHKKEQQNIMSEIFTYNKCMGKYALNPNIIAAKDILINPERN